MSNRPLPTFATDAEAEEFVATSDLSDYDLSGGERVRYEFSPKIANIGMRVPQQLLEAVKAEATREGIPYQRFIRRTLERALLDSKQRSS